MLAQFPRHRRLILNALGTDITHELLGEDMSVGHAMSFSPHVHTEVHTKPVSIVIFTLRQLQVSFENVTPCALIRARFIFPDTYTMY